MATTRRMTSRGRASPQKVLMTILLVSWLCLNTVDAAPTPVRTRPPTNPAGDLTAPQGQEPAARSSDPTAGDGLLLADPAEQNQVLAARASAELHRRVGPSAIPSPGQVEELPALESYSDSQDKRKKSAFRLGSPPRNESYGAHQVEHTGFPASSPYPTTANITVHHYISYEEPTADDDLLLQYIVPNQPLLPQLPPPANQYTPEEEVPHYYQRDTPAHSQSQPNYFQEPKYPSHEVQKVDNGYPLVPSPGAYYTNSVSPRPYGSQDKAFYPTHERPVNAAYAVQDTVRQPGYNSGYENVHPKPLLKKHFRLNWNSSSIPLTKNFTVLEPVKFQQSLVDSNTFKREYMETIYVPNNLTDLRNAKETLKGDFDIATCNPCHSQYSIKPYPSKNDWFERFLECGTPVYCPVLKMKILKPCEHNKPMINICNPCRRSRKLVKTIAPGSSFNEIELPYKTIKTKYQTFFDHHKNRFEIVTFSDRNKEYEQCHGVVLPPGYDLSDLYSYY